MTIAIPLNRALSTKLAGRSFNVVTRLGYNPWLARVNHHASNDSDIKSSLQCQNSSRICFIATRTYATRTAAKPASRPKAHTGRAPARRTTKAAAKKPGPKTAVGKAKVGRKPKAKKATPKPKKKLVKKPASPRSLNTARIAKEKKAKETALLNGPKKLPESAWQVLFAEHQHNAGSHPVSESINITKQAAQKFRSLTLEEKEHYNHLSHTNKEKNERELKKWLSSYSPEQIKAANNARAELKRNYRLKHPNLKQINRYPPLKDDRLVTRPRSGYNVFTKDRWASGDFAHMQVAEAGKLIGREWKALSANDKQKYQSQGAADKSRYEDEKVSVYGAVPARRKTAV